MQKTLSNLEIYATSNFDEDQIVKFAKSAYHLDNLRHISLFLHYTLNRIGEYSLRWLGKSIQNKPYLKSLVLDFFGNEDAKTLIAKIPPNLSAIQLPKLVKVVPQTINALRKNAFLPKENV
mgnify:CR=1 FL=1